MFIKEEMLEDLASIYGEPKTWNFNFEAGYEEFNMIRDSQKDGREHDFTIYAVKDGRIIVNAKHFYQPGLFRAPSGGIKPGEDIVDGICREMFEETGCRIELKRFLLRTNMIFTFKSDFIKWHSYVFQAEYLSGNFSFTDINEIREINLADLADFERYSEMMRKTDIAGFHYRAALHEEIKSMLTGVK